MKYSDFYHMTCKMIRGARKLQEDNYIPPPSTEGAKAPALKNNSHLLPQLRTQFLTLANKERQSIGLNPLTLDPALNDHAQNWAEHMALAKKMSHSHTPAMGENVAWRSPCSSPNEDVANLYQQWLDEKGWYQYDRYPNLSTNGKEVGHYTALVWKTSSRTGFGIAWNGDQVYACCNFDPPGNYVGQFPY